MRHALLSLVLFLPLLAGAQGVAIGAGNPTPDPSALLDLQSTTQGLLPPRMTTAQRTAIAAPATGLVVYDTTVGALFLRTTSAWVQLSTGIPSWSLVGNSGIDPATNFIGTTDGQPLQFRVSNLTAGTVNLTMRNTSLGAFSLAAGGTGNWNAAFGYEALRFNLNGGYNCAFGARALKANTSGYDNVALGVEAMTSNIGGYRNTAVGNASLYSNTEGDYNTVMGVWALFSNTTGSSNVAIGVQALASAQSASHLVAVGDSALLSNTTGTENTAIGSSALQSNTAGHYSTAVGYHALISQSLSGGQNTAVGARVLENNLLGQNNTGCGAFSLQQLTDGANNTAIGKSALASIQTGTGNVGLGSNVGPTGDYSITAALGTYAAPTANFRINIGGPPSMNLVGVFGAVQNLSDGRFKFDVTEDVPGIAFISKLRPVTYHLDALKVDNFTGVAERVEKDGVPEMLDLYRERMKEVSTQKLTGFIAQEVEQAAREIGYDFDGVQHPKNDGDTYTLGYSTFVVPLVKAVQEQQAMIEEQRAMIEEQQRTIAAQSERMDAQAEDLRAMHAELRNLSLTSSKNP